jgi:CHAT domain-containing protein
MDVTALASGGTATLARVIEELRKGHDILYLVCHGYFVHGEPQILLEDSSGRVHRVSGVEFVDVLRDMQRPPRLVVLASCQSASAGGEASSDDHGALAALGPRMAEAGISHAGQGVDTDYGGVHPGVLLRA